MYKHQAHTHRPVFWLGTLSIAFPPDIHSGSGLLIESKHPLQRRVRVGFPPTSLRPQVMFSMYRDGRKGQGELNLAINARFQGVF
jgi:hypothetical protein